MPVTPYNILFLSANPEKTGRSGHDRKFREMEEALTRAENRASIRLHSDWAVRAKDLQRSLLARNPRIVHFSGEGIQEEGIVLENEHTGEYQVVPTEALAELFALFSDKGIEGVIMDACISEEQIAIIGAHIPYVIGLGEEVESKVREEFARGFYDALGAGKSIAFAYSFGKNAVNLVQMDGAENFICKTNDTLLAEKAARQRIETQITQTDAQQQWTEIQQRDHANAYGLSAALGNTLLEQLIAQLGIDTELGLWHLVNCDRHQPRRYFWDKFESILNNNLQSQFILINACPSQQPNSFSERMIYELIEEELEELDESLHVPRSEPDKRIRFESLPLGRNTRNSKKKLIRYFRERYQLGNMRELMALFESDQGPRRYEYVASLFHVGKSDWETWIAAEYLPWIIQQFTEIESDFSTRFFILPRGAC